MTTERKGSHTVYLLLGSNVGDRQRHLEYARMAITRRIGQITRASQIYQTEAWGVGSQGAFLNQALAVETWFTPEDVLDQVQAIEAERGRVRAEHWGPRTLDIDIAFYDDQVIRSKQLTVPHPHIPQRKFALIPLIEIAGHMMHPVLQQTLRDLFEQTTDQCEVSILGDG